MTWPEISSFLQEQGLISFFIYRLQSFSGFAINSDTPMMNQGRRDNQVARTLLSIWVVGEEK
ncbi:MAG TPA: hypothetical protein VFC63_00410 [Blastocatellia bacterium]|nr:hypothetical protein [Blastocatellia bacterium]